MKRIFALSATAILAFLLFACSAGAGAATQSASIAPISTQTPVQGIQSASEPTPDEESDTTQKPGQQPPAATSPSPETAAGSSVLDDISNSLNDMGGLNNTLETLNPADLQD